MKLIVGLGNPGSQYDKTRHNIGFMSIDYLVDYLNIDLKLEKKFNSLFYKGKYKDTDFIVIKPLTYMNLSGESVIKVANYYNVDINDIIVVVDDINLEVGKLRLRVKGSSGGHNGLKNIEKHLNSNEYKRIRIGVGSNNKYLNLSDYVLAKFNKEELDILEKSINDSKDALLLFLENKNFLDIMTKFN